MANTLNILLIVALAGIVSYMVAFVAADIVRDIRQALRRARAQRARQLENVGLLASLEPMDNQDRRDHYTAKRAGMLPWRVMA